MTALHGGCLLVLNLGFPLFIVAGGLRAAGLWPQRNWRWLWWLALAHSRVVLLGFIVGHRLSWAGLNSSTYVVIESAWPWTQGWVLFLEMWWHDQNLWGVVTFLPEMVLAMGVLVVLARARRADRLQMQPAPEDK